MTSVQDLTKLPPPSVIEILDFETVLAQHRADLLARYPAAEPVMALESEPLVKLIEANAYRETLYRARVNDAARAYLLAYATGADLDHKGAFYGLARMAGETDERFRKRIQLRIAALAGNGTRDHYELVAMSASANVHDAIAVQPEPGRVQVLLWLVDVAQATLTLPAVLAALNADDARPLGVPVSVALAQPKPINVTAHIRREAGAPVNLAAQLQASLPAALASYARLGREVPRSWITTRLHVEGVASVTYPDPDAPSELTAMAGDEYPVAGLVTIVDEGLQ